MKDTYAELAQALRNVLPALDSNRDVAVSAEHDAESVLMTAYRANPTTDDDEYNERFGELQYAKSQAIRRADDAYRIWHYADRLCSVAERMYREETP